MLIAILFLAGAMALVVLIAARWAGYLRGTPGLTRSQRQVLEQYGLFYRTLTGEARTRYEDIAAHFLDHMQWRGAGISVVDEMKVLIAGTAAQLLHGLKQFRFTHFHTVMLFRDTYRSGRSGRMHQGEVRPSEGLIIISWGDHVRGYANPSDGRNVGLHELAHALWFEHKAQAEEGTLLHPERLQDWIDQADAEIERIRAGNSTLFREYAGTNQVEFFAVAVEYFFEQAAQFREADPRLYGTMKDLLGQDPAADRRA
jgi:Mlc titration factor MtfA (ptsG expression regulator)